MTEQDLIHKIEWVNKRCSLKGEPLTQSQIELLKFVFADNVVNKISSNPLLVDSLPCSHQYSRNMNQPYPRKCVKCGEVEKANFH